MVDRIFGEEKLLARDLEGYQAYRQKVRYRLVPHLVEAFIAIIKLI